MPQQHPILTGHDGGRTIDFDTQERSAWQVIATACDDALKALHPQHPERHQFLTMSLECRRAAGRPLEPAQLQMA